MYGNNTFYSVPASPGVERHYTAEFTTIMGKGGASKGTPPIDFHSRLTPLLDMYLRHFRPILVGDGHPELLAGGPLLLQSNLKNVSSEWMRRVFKKQIVSRLDSRYHEMRTSHVRHSQQTHAAKKCSAAAYAAQCQGQQHTVAVANMHYDLSSADGHVQQENYAALNSVVAASSAASASLLAPLISDVAPSPFSQLLSEEDESNWSNFEFEATAAALHSNVPQQRACMDSPVQFGDIAPKRLTVAASPSIYILPPPAPAPLPAQLFGRAPGVRAVSPEFSWDHRVEALDRTDVSSSQRQQFAKHATRVKPVFRPQLDPTGRMIAGTCLPCDICKGVFKSSAALVSHKRSCVSKNQNYAAALANSQPVCEVCLQVFTTPGRLTQHQNSSISCRPPSALLCLMDAT